jgi:hypothetical protein
MMILFVSNCHGEYCCDWTISSAEILSILGAMIAFFVALHQYRKAQKWKRKEFMLAYYDKIFNNFNVKRGMVMLDWNRTEIPLQEKEIANKNSFWFDDELFRSALRVHFEMSAEEGFSDQESIIRLVIDEFLEKVGSYYPLIKANLIKKEDIVGINDIMYWIDIIGNKNNLSKDSETRKQLWKYIVSYKFHNIINLCNEFGYKIEEITPILEKKC